MGAGFLYGQTGGGKKSVIKSIQRGTISIPINYSSGDATISSVDLNSAVIICNGSRGGLSSSTDAALNRVMARLSLTNSTTLNAKAYTTASSNATVVSYMVVEFDNVKSVQRGSISISSGATASATITAVDLNKSLLLPSGFSTDAATNSQRALFTLELTNSTTITAQRAGTAASSAIINYSLVEFN